MPSSTDRGSCSAPHPRDGCRWRGGSWTTALKTLDTTRHEWVDADPATVAAAGWVLVDRMGRLLIAAALVAAGRKGRTGSHHGTVGQRRASLRVEPPSPSRARSCHANPCATIRRPLARGFATGRVVTTSALQRLGRCPAPQQSGRPHAGDRRRHRLAGHGDVLRLLRAVLRRCRRHRRDRGRPGGHYRRSGRPACAGAAGSAR